MVAGYEAQWVLLRCCDGIKLLNNMLSASQKNLTLPWTLLFVKFVGPESLDSRAA